MYAISDTSVVTEGSNSRSHLTHEETEVHCEEVASARSPLLQRSDPVLGPQAGASSAVLSSVGLSLLGRQLPLCAPHSNLTWETGHRE